MQQQTIIVKYHRPAIMGAEGIRLQGGVNTVDLAAWKKVMNHPTIKALTDEGVIEFDLPIDGKGLADPHDFLMTVKKQPDAIATVKETTDLELLNAWLTKDNRKVVIGAIKTQIKLVMAPPEIRDRSKTEAEKAAAAGTAGEGVVPVVDEGAAAGELTPDFTDDVE